MPNDTDSRRQAAPAPFKPVDLAVAAILLATVLVLGGLRTALRPARSTTMASTSPLQRRLRGSRLSAGINLPSEPWQTKYPFLYPACLALLSTVWPSFPQNLFLIQMFSVCCAAGAAASAYLFLVRFRYGSTWMCAASCLIAGTSASHLFFATQALSEALFGLLGVAGLWACETASRRSTTTVRQFLLGVLSSVSFDARTIGAASIVGSADHLRRYGRISRSILCGMALPVVAWIGWVAIAATGTAAPAYYSVQNYTSWWLESSVNVPLLNLLWLVFGTVQLSAEPLFDALPWPIPIALGVLTWIHIIGGPACRRLVPKTLTVYAVVLTLGHGPPEDSLSRCYRSSFFTWLNLWLCHEVVAPGSLAVMRRSFRDRTGLR